MKRLLSIISTYTFLITTLYFGNLQQAFSQPCNCSTDHTPPSLQCNTKNVWLDEDGYASITAADVIARLTDNCASRSNITVCVSQTQFSCEDLNKGPNHSPTLGQVQVIITATDCNHNRSTCTTWVNVHYKPKIYAECVGDLTVTLVDGTVTITPDMINDGSYVVAPCGPDALSYSVSPSTFTEPGTYNVVLTVTDQYGNTATCTTVVTVEAEQQESIVTAVCKNATVYLDENGAASITASDVDGGSTDYTSLSVDPSTFDCSNVGDNEVTLTAMDDDGNTSTCTATVTVIDDIYPAFSGCPDDITEYTGEGATSCGTNVSWTAPTATDNCGTPDVTSNHSSGDFFDVGTTTVTYTATDAAGNETTCSFDVTVIDNTDPVLSACPDDITEYTGANATSCGKTVSWTAPTATDNCSTPDVTSNYSPGDFFDVGTTTVTYTATDAAGNETTCSFDVTVVDNTPPTLTVSLSPSVLWPPNHQLQTITATVQATDNCCSTFTYELVSITSNEADNGLGDGDQANDIQNATTGTADYSFDLRAERSGSGTGRIYTVTYQATDCNNNTATKSATVTVPKNQPKEPDLSYDNNQSGSFGITNIYPNPFNQSALITIAIPESNNVSLTIYNSTGGRVKELVGSNLSQGSHNIAWDGNDANGQPVSSGIYYIILKTGTFTNTMPITIIR